MEIIQAINVNEAKQNFKKYCDDVVENNDIVIVSRNGNGKENLVLLNLIAYNELQKSKEKLDYMVKLEKNYKQLAESKVVVKRMMDLEAMEDE